MTSIEIVSIYDQRVITARVSGCDPIPVDDYCGSITPTRAIAVYGRRRGAPWEVTTVRIGGPDRYGVHDEATLALDADRPEWLARFVDENMPKDL